MSVLGKRSIPLRREDSAEGEAGDPGCVFYSKSSAIYRKGPCHELARDINPGGTGNK